MNQAIENQIDSTDVRIIEALIDDGRLAYSALADHPIRWCISVCGS